MAQQNPWLSANKKELDAIRRIMIEAEYVQEYDQLPLRTIQRLLKGAEVEILRLQSMVNTSKK